MFLERVKFLERHSPEISTVTFIPLDCSMSCYGVKHTAAEMESIRQSVQQPLPFFPFIFDVEKKDNILYILTDPVPSQSLEEYSDQLSLIKKKYLLFKILKGILEWVYFTSTSGWGLLEPDPNSFRVTPEGELMYPAAWRLLDKNISGEEQPTIFLNIIEKVMSLFKQPDDFSLEVSREKIQKEGPAKYIEQMISSLMYAGHAVAEVEQTIVLDRHECVNHPEKKGEYRCRVCKNFYCQECVIIAYEQPVCNGCLEDRPVQVREYLDKITSGCPKTRYGIMNKNFVKHFFSSLFFSKESLSSLFENLSLKEIGGILLMYILVTFFTYSQMNVITLGRILAWQFSGIGLFFVIALVWYNYDNPLQILFSLLFPLIATGFILSAVAYFYPVFCLYFGFIWASLLTVNFLIYSLKIEIYEIFITWIIVLFVLFTFLNNLLQNIF